MKGYFYVALDKDAFVELGYSENLKDTESETGCTIYASTELDGNRTTNAEIKKLFPGITKQTTLKEAIEIAEILAEITGGNFKTYHMGKQDK